MSVDQTHESFLPFNACDMLTPLAQLGRLVCGGTVTLAAHDESIRVTGRGDEHIMSFSIAAGDPARGQVAPARGQVALDYDRLLDMLRFVVGDRPASELPVIIQSSGITTAHLLFDEHTFPLVRRELIADSVSVATEDLTAAIPTRFDGPPAPRDWRRMLALDVYQGGVKLLAHDNAMTCVSEIPGTMTGVLPHQLQFNLPPDVVAAAVPLWDDDTVTFTWTSATPQALVTLQCGTSTVTVPSSPDDGGLRRRLTSAFGGMPVTITVGRESMLEALQSCVEHSVDKERPSPKVFLKCTDGPLILRPDLGRIDAEPVTYPVRTDSSHARPLLPKYVSAFALWRGLQDLGGGRVTMEWCAGDEWFTLTDPDAAIGPDHARYVVVEHHEPF